MDIFHKMEHLTYSPVSSITNFNQGIYLTLIKLKHQVNTGYYVPCIHFWNAPCLNNVKTNMHKCNNLFP